MIHPLSEQKGKKARIFCGSRNFLLCQLSLWEITLINKEPTWSQRPLPFFLQEHTNVGEYGDTHTTDLLSHLEMMFHALVWTRRLCCCCNRQHGLRIILSISEKTTYIKDLLLHFNWNSIKIQISHFLM